MGSLRLYREEAVIADKIGKVLLAQELPRVTVRLPRALADQAVVAWERDYEESNDQPETFEQATVRGFAATLGLLGSAITDRGRPDGDEVVVELTPEVIGAAVEASDHLPYVEPGAEEAPRHP